MLGQRGVEVLEDTQQLDPQLRHRSIKKLHEGADGGRTSTRGVGRPLAACSPPTSAPGVKQPDEVRKMPQNAAKKPASVLHDHGDERV